jgi:hypothetical protein
MAVDNLASASKMHRELVFDSINMQPFDSTFETRWEAELLPKLGRNGIVVILVSKEKNWEASTQSSKPLAKVEKIFFFNRVSLLLPEFFPYNPRTSYVESRLEREKKVVFPYNLVKISLLSPRA